MAAISSAVAPGLQSFNIVAPGAAPHRLVGPVVPHRRGAKASSSACAEGARRKTGTLTGCFPRTPSTTASAVSCIVLREAFPGRDIKVPVRQSRAPSLMKRAAALLRMVAQKPVPAAAWKGYDANWAGRRPNAGSEFATMFFPQDVTRRLNAKARASGVSLNSLLMHTLAKASQPDLDDGPRFG